MILVKLLWEVKSQVPSSLLSPEEFDNGGRPFSISLSFWLNLACWKWEERGVSTRLSSSLELEFDEGTKDPSRNTMSHGKSI